MTLKIVLQFASWLLAGIHLVDKFNTTPQRLLAERA